MENILIFNMIKFQNFWNPLLRKYSGSCSPEFRAGTDKIATKNVCANEELIEVKKDGTHSDFIFGPLIHQT